MEPKLKDRVNKVLSYIKQQIKSDSIYKDDANKLLKYYKIFTKNKRLRYLVEIMIGMNFKGNELIIEPNLENFYMKFFTLAQTVIENKNETKEIKMVITSADLNPFQEETKKIIFFYLQFSILVEKSIQIFFAFLNPKLCETLLEGKFTCLDMNTLDNSEGLLKSYQLEKDYGKLKKIGNEKDIELIGFEPLVEKYLKNYFDKKIEGNDNLINKTLNPSKLNFAVGNLNIKDNLNKVKADKFSSDMKKSINENININQNFSKTSINKIENNINTDKNNKELKKDKDKTIIQLKNLPGNQENRMNLKENEVSKNASSIPNNSVNLQKTSGDSNTRKTIKKIETEQKNEIILKSIEKKSEDIDNCNKLGLSNKKEIELLKKNLSKQQNVNSYFQTQKLKYLKIYKNNLLMKNALNNLSLQRLHFKFKSPKIKYWHINKALTEIINLFSNNNNIMKTEYGFFISGNKILFYSPYYSQQENEILYNSKYLKQLNYEYATKKESSFKTYTDDMGNNNDKIDYFLIKGIDFEKNWEFFFDSNFDLPNLPNIFFPVVTTLDSIYLKKISLKSNNNLISNILSTKNTNNEITFKKYINDLFNSYIETDFAKINMNDSDIQPEFIFKPFINEPPILVYEDTNNVNKWTSQIKSSNEFKIYNNSIILGEVKNTVPDKILNIENEKKIDPKNIQRALYFVLYKLIKKIDYYLNFVKYEVLDNSEDIKKFKIQLFLIYNNKPISEMNVYIKQCLDNLIKNGYIHNNFIFQIVYSSPSISSLNINNLSKEMKTVKRKIHEIENGKNKEIEELKTKIEKLEAKINILEGNGKLEKVEK